MGLIVSEVYDALIEAGGFPGHGKGRSRRRTTSREHGDQRRHC